jgi:hypothetical protein
MIGISIQVILQEDESNGGPCAHCGEIIIGKRYVMMLQIGNPEDGHLTPFNYQLCRGCYIAAALPDPDDQKSTDNK